MSTGVLHTFYCSNQWKLFREGIILTRGTICQRCGKHIFESGDIQIHHTPIELTGQNYKDVNISLNPDNVELICSTCHNKEHDRWCGAKKRHKGIFIVYGAPLSGKKTFVKENMNRGDLVIDIDELYSAISFMDIYDKPDNLKNNVFAIKNLLIDNIKTRYGNFNSAWIIGGYPLVAERQRLELELGAETILIRCTKDECLRRLDVCRGYRQDNKTEWKRYISEWFDKFTE